MTDALTLRDLSKTYKNGFQALKGIDLTVPEGEFYALLGPNGAGKSTTIGIISSLTKKTSGTVEIFGHNLDTGTICLIHDSYIYLVSLNKIFSHFLNFM